MDDGSAQSKGDADQQHSGAVEDSPSAGPGDGEPFPMRSRGRRMPRRSKEKPEPRVTVTRESAAAVRTHMLEIADGEDIVEAVANFARRRQSGVCVLSGSGAVSSASLRQPGEPCSVIELSGPLEILSLSGAFMPPPSPPDATGLKAILSGGHGQVIGGNVVGDLRARGHATIVAVIFSKVSYDRLSPEHDVADDPGTVPAADVVDDPGKVPAAVTLTGIVFVLPFA
jgi:predicted DNA-binding protein with PD1-like motif